MIALSSITQSDSKHPAFVSYLAEMSDLNKFKVIEKESVLVCSSFYSIAWISSVSRRKNSNNVIGHYYQGTWIAYHDTGESQFLCFNSVVRYLLYIICECLLQRRTKRVQHSVTKRNHFMILQVTRLLVLAYVDDWHSYADMHVWR